jgi:hypothetical protein
MYVMALHTISKDRHNAATASIKKPIHNVKEQAIHGPRHRLRIEIRAGICCLHLWSIQRLGGAYRDRTDDPLLAKQVLSQLS